MNKGISTVDFNINIIDKEFQISDGIKEMDRVCQQIVRADELVKKTKEDIKATKSGKRKIFRRKKDVEALKTVTIDLAETQEVMVQAQKEISENQRKLSFISSQILSASIVNLATCQSAAARLEAELKNATEELSDIKRETIKNVLKQIRAQQSILEKQARAERRDEELASKLSNLVKSFHSQEEQIAEQSKVDEELIELIKEQKHQNSMQENEIIALQEENKVLRETLNNTNEALQIQITELKNEVNRKPSWAITCTSLLVGLCGVITAVISIICN